MRLDRQQDLADTTGFRFQPIPKRIHHLAIQIVCASRHSLAVMSSLEMLPAFRFEHRLGSAIHQHDSMRIAHRRRDLPDACHQSSIDDSGRSQD